MWFKLSMDKNLVVNTGKHAIINYREGSKGMGRNAKKIKKFYFVIFICVSDHPNYLGFLSQHIFKY